MQNIERVNESIRVMNELADRMTNKLVGWKTQDDLKPCPQCGGKLIPYHNPTVCGGRPLAQCMGRCNGYVLLDASMEKAS